MTASNFPVGSKSKINLSAINFTNLVAIQPRIEHKAAENLHPIPEGHDLSPNI